MSKRCLMVVVLIGVIGLGLTGCSWFEGAISELPLVQPYPVDRAIEVLKTMKAKDPLAFPFTKDGQFKPRPLLKEGLDYSGVSRALQAGAKAEGQRVLIIDDFVQNGIGSCVWDAEGFCHGDYVAAIVMATAPGAQIYVCDVFLSGVKVSDCLKGALQDDQGYHTINMSFMFVGYYRFYTSPAIYEVKFFCPPWLPNQFQCVQDTPGFMSEVDLIDRYLSDLYAKGTQSVAAAGNEALHNAVGFPAFHDGVVASGAIFDADFAHVAWDVCEEYNAKRGTITCFSNYGRDLYNIGYRSDISLGDVRLTEPYGFGGTSGASPFNTGSINLVAATCQISPKAAADKIKEVSSSLTDKFKSGLENARTDVWSAIQDCVTEIPPDNIYSRYDVDKNCRIDDTEVMTAIKDWVYDKVSDSDVILLVVAWVTDRDVC